jgi:hypothetical protein
MADLREILDSCQRQLEGLPVHVRACQSEVAAGRKGLEQETARLQQEWTETSDLFAPITRDNLLKQINRLQLQHEPLRAEEEKLAALGGSVQSQVEAFGARVTAIHELMAEAGELVVSPGGLLDRTWIMLQSLFVPIVPIWVVLTAAMTGDSAEAAILQLYEWERDRLLTLAKGAAGAAVTVLAGLIAAGFGGKAGVNSVTFFVAVPLVAILLFWGGFVLARLRNLAEQYPASLELVR